MRNKARDFDGGDQKVAIQNEDPDDFEYTADPPSCEDDDDDQGWAYNSEANRNGDEISLTGAAAARAVEEAVSGFIRMWKPEFLTSAALWAGSKGGRAVTCADRILSSIQSHKFLYQADKDTAVAAVRTAVADLTVSACVAHPWALRSALPPILTLVDSSRQEREDPFTETSFGETGDAVERSACDPSLRVLGALAARAVEAVVEKSGALRCGVTVGGRPAWRGFGPDEHFALWSASRTVAARLATLMSSSHASVSPDLRAAVAAICLFVVTPSPWDRAAHARRVNGVLFQDGLLAALAAAATAGMKSGDGAVRARPLRWALLVASGRVPRARQYLAQVPGFIGSVLSGDFNQTHPAEAVLWAIHLAGVPRTTREAKRNMSRHSRGLSVRSMLRTRGAASRTQSRATNEDDESISGDVSSPPPEWPVALTAFAQSVSRLARGKATGADDWKGALQLKQVLRGLNWAGGWDGKMTGPTVTRELIPLRAEVARALVQLRRSRAKHKERRAVSEAKAGGRVAPEALAAESPEWSAARVRLFETLALIDEQLKDLTAGAKGGSAKKD